MRCVFSNASSQCHCKCLALHHAGMIPRGRLKVDCLVNAVAACIGCMVCQPPAVSVPSKSPNCSFFEG